MNKLLSFLFIFMSFTVRAQVGTDTGSSVGNVVIETELKPNIEDANKIEIDPSLEEPSPPQTNYQYSFPNLSYKPRAVYSPIDPVYLKPEQEADYSDNYIELGAGNYFSSYLDARIHNTRDKYYSYGLNLRHQASSRSRNPSQGVYSYNRIQAFGMRERGSVLAGEIDYQRNVIHYYGYADSLEYGLRDINQIYNDINANMKWMANGSVVESSVDLGFNVFDRFHASEMTVFLNNANHFDAGDGTFHLELGGMYTILRQSTNYQRIFIDLFPHHEFKINKIRFDVGFFLTTFVDSNTSVFRGAPRVKAETYLVPDKLRAFIGVDGGLRKNTLKSLSYENFFLGNELQVQNPYELVNIYAGMNGNFKRFVEYGIEMRHSFTRNQYLFVTDTNLLRNMQMVYDSFNIFSFTGELKFDVNENVDLGFVGKFYSYSNNRETAAWQLPTYDVKLFTTVRLVQKLYISLSYYGISPRPARNLEGEQFSLKAIHDLNMGFEYRYKKNISAFLNLQNVLNQRYMLWNHYGAQGFNLLAGITFSI